MITAQIAPRTASTWRSTAGKRSAGEAPGRAPESVARTFALRVVLEDPLIYQVRFGRRKPGGDLSGGPRDGGRGPGPAGAGLIPSILRSGGLLGLSGTASTASPRRRRESGMRSGDESPRRQTAQLTAAPSSEPIARPPRVGVRCVFEDDSGPSGGGRRRGGRRPRGPRSSSAGRIAAERVTASRGGGREPVGDGPPGTALPSGLLRPAFGGVQRVRGSGAGGVGVLAATTKLGIEPARCARVSQRRSRPRRSVAHRPAGEVAARTAGRKRRVGQAGPGAPRMMEGGLPAAAAGSGRSRIALCAASSVMARRELELRFDPSCARGYGKRFETQGEGSTHLARTPKRAGSAARTGNPSLLSQRSRIILRGALFVGHHRDCPQPTVDLDPGSAAVVLRRGPHGETDRKREMRCARGGVSAAVPGAPGELFGNRVQM